MKKKTWIGWCVALFVLILLYLFSASALRAQMESTLSSACNRPVLVQSAHMVLPAGIRLSGITVPALQREPVQPLSIGEIQVRMVVSDLLQGRQGLELEICRPKFSMTWTPQTRALFSPASLKGTAGAVPLPLARMRVTEGEVTLVDETVIPAVEWVVRDLQVEISASARPGEYAYRFSGILAGGTQEDLGKIQSEGTWISGGPLDGTVSIEHRDLRILSPYLRKVLGTPPSKGSAALTTRMTIHQGVLMAHNDVTAEGLLFPTGAATTLDMEGNRLVELLRDEKGQVHLHFIVAGKLGDRLNWSDLTAGALREAMRQAVARSIRSVLAETEQNRPAEEVLRDKLNSLGR